MMSTFKFHDEFRDPSLVLPIAKLLSEECKKNNEYRFMEFCGGHTHVIFRNGLRELLPQNLHMIHGPGCPVCVLPRGRIDTIINLAYSHPDLIICTYADLMRVPGSKNISMLKAKVDGADIRMVYSPEDALKVASENPNKNVVFIAIGFETTAPASASAIISAEKMNLKNFFTYCLHLLTPPAILAILDPKETSSLGSVKLDGFIGPGHVSTVIGTFPYNYFTEKYKKPVVISGFTPLDMMQSLLMLTKMVNENKNEIQNQYTRSVTTNGNEKAKKLLENVFELREDFQWRGLGKLERSAYKINNKFSAFDAEKKFSIPNIDALDHPACQCGAIIRGVKTPLECKLFAKACTPDNPIGSCMVSSEGTCSAYYTYRE